LKQLPNTEEAEAKRSCKIRIAHFLVNEPPFDLEKRFTEKAICKTIPQTANSLH